MPLRRTPQSTPAALAARRANSLKSTGPRTREGKQRSYASLKRHLGRLLGMPEALNLDQEPGAAIHLYNELIAPYEPAPPLLAMHFRDLARLQLELQAWEGIRDAEMEYRAQQTALERRRREMESNRELRATFSEILDTGLCRMPDSCGKFNAECDSFAMIREVVKLGNFSDLEVPLARLYGIKLQPDTNTGMMICACAKRLMPPEPEPPKEPVPAWPLGQPYPTPRPPAAKDPEPEQVPQEAEEDGESTEGADESRQEALKDLMEMVEEEERRAMTAWQLALYEGRITNAAGQARLAPKREDHWMNRQGDRLRQAIDRKMRFTPVLLRSLGLANESRPTTPAETPGKDEITSTAVSWNVPSNQGHSSKRGARPKAGMSFRINKTRATSKSPKG